MASYIGGKLYISPNLPATEDLAGFEAVTGFEQIKRVVTVGEIGATHEDLTTTVLETGVTRHTSGARDGGTRDVFVDGEDFSDPGLAIVQAANGSNDEYSFKLVLPETTHFWYGIIMNLRTPQIDASTSTGTQFAIATNSQVFRTSS